MTRALVLGATGFIGGHVVREALRRGWEVHCLRRRHGATGHLGSSNVQWRDGDLDRPETLTGLFHGVDIVFHVAGYYPSGGENVPKQVAHATRQTRTVLEAAVLGNVGRLVYTSTLTTIGVPPTGEARLPDERDSYVPGTLPRSAYYECKYAMESEVLRAAAAGLPAVVVNPTAVLGPGSKAGGIGGALLLVAKGRGVAWLPVETNVIDVRDAAVAHIRAAEVGAVGERYILGGHNAQLRDLLSLAAEISGRAPPRFELPLWLVDLTVRVGDLSPRRNMLGNHLRAIRLWQGYDCSKAQRALDLRPRPLEETFRDTFAWFAEQGHLAGN